MELVVVLRMLPIDAGWYEASEVVSPGLHNVSTWDETCWTSPDVCLVWHRLSHSDNRIEVMGEVSSPLLMIGPPPLK